MPSKTRAAKLAGGWPLAMLPVLADDGVTVLGIHTKRVRPSDIEAGVTHRDGRPCQTVDQAILEAESHDRHGRLRRKFRRGRVVIEDQPLTAELREKEIRWRLGQEFTEEDQRMAIIAGDMETIRQRRNEIAAQVDDDIATGKPLT